MLVYSPHEAGALKDGTYAYIEIVHVQVVEVLSKYEFHRHVSHKCAHCSAKVDSFGPGSRKFDDAIAKLIRLFANDALPPRYVGLGKECVQGSAAAFVDIVLHAENGGASGRKFVVGPSVLVPASVLTVQLLEVGRVVDVELMWAYADNRAFPGQPLVLYGYWGMENLTVFLVHLCNFPCVLATADNIIITFVIASNGR